MNDKKICFVSAVNDENMYKESLAYIKNLDIPLGFEVEILPIKNSTSIFNAYNKAIDLSDAKYKVYLHQDVFILNKNFINDILNIFNKNESIGLIGACGAKSLPKSGVWWESKDNFGKVYENRTGGISLLKFNDVVDDYEIIDAIDGLIMITQYDIKWRSDIFDSWHFYDISQSLEFKKKGYQTVVPKQNNPWFMHWCGVVSINNYEECRQLFVENYLDF